MNDRLFWGLLAGLLVGWVVLFFLVVMPEINQLDATEATLNGRMRELQALEKKDPIATAELVEKRQQELASYEAELQKALDQQRARDQAFETYINNMNNPEPGAWKAAYIDAFDKLSSDYRRHAGLGETDKLPFSDLKLPGTIDRADLPKYQKKWRMQETLVRLAMKHQGIVEACSDKPHGDTKGAAPPPGQAAKPAAGAAPAAPPRFSVERLPAQFGVLVAPSEVNALLQDVVTDPAINFEILELELSKQITELKLNKIEELDSTKVLPEGTALAASEEPRVRLVVNMDALDWSERKAP